MPPCDENGSRLVNKVETVQSIQGGVAGRPKLGQQHSDGGWDLGGTYTGLPKLFCTVRTYMNLYDCSSVVCMQLDRCFP